MSTEHEKIWKTNLLNKAVARWHRAGLRTRKVRFRHDGVDYYSLLKSYSIGVYDERTGKEVTGISGDIDELRDDYQPHELVFRK